jgi:cytochrome c-type biogenesis protein CcmH
MRRAIVLSLLGLLALPVQADKVSEDPLERRMLGVAKDLRCAVCQNQPVSESNAPLAQDMRAIIREQIRAGKSDAEIKRYFVERYGDYVLMKPPARGFGALVWLGPVLLFVAIAGGGVMFLRRRLHAAPPAAPASLSAEDRERIARARREAGDK